MDEELEKDLEQVGEQVEEHFEETANTLTDITQGAYDLLIDHGFNFIVVIITFFVGMFIIKKLVKLMKKMMAKSKVDASLIPFVGSLSSIALKVILIISLAEMLGFKTTSLIAVLGAAGLAVGLALQGALTNFAGGVLVLVFKPYRIGDLIESQGEKGTVKEIQILQTILLTPDNKTVIIPNGAVAGGNITNYTKEGVIRVDMTFGISYESNIKVAKDVLLKAMNEHPLVLKDPKAFVGVSALADSSVNIAARAFTLPDDYWDVMYDLYESGKIGLDEAGVTIPFPQVDVHMKPEPK